MKKVLLSALIMGTMVVGANAACTTKSCTGKIEKLYMTAGGTLYVGTDGDENALNCGSAETAGVYMSLKEGDVGKNSMYSLLLTAQTTDKSVTIRIQENTDDCRVLYVTTD